MSTALATLWASIVRTLVPIIVGAILGWLTAGSIPVDPDLEMNLTAVFTGLFSAVYYVAVRLFERFVSPKFGWLLGLAQQPTAYKPDPPAGVQQ